MRQSHEFEGALNRASNRLASPAGALLHLFAHLLLCVAARRLVCLAALRLVCLAARRLVCLVARRLVCLAALLLICVHLRFTALLRVVALLPAGVHPPIVAPHLAGALPAVAAHDLHRLLGREPSFPGFALCTPGQCLRKLDVYTVSSGSSYPAARTSCVPTRSVQHGKSIRNTNIRLATNFMTHSGTSNDKGNRKMCSRCNLTTCHRCQGKFTSHQRERMAKYNERKAREAEQGN